MNPTVDINDYKQVIAEAKRLSIADEKRRLELNAAFDHVAETINGMKHREILSANNAQALSLDLQSKLLRSKTIPNTYTEGRL